jgi:hypothetical protein
MSLNKFTDLAKKNEWMNINCNDVVANEITCDKLTASEINGTRSYGVKSVQSADLSIAGSALELPISVETDLDANALEVGDFATYKIAGLITNTNTGALTFKLYAGPTGTSLLYLLQIPIRPAATGSKNFNIECDITVRNANTLALSASFLQTNDTGSFSEVFSSLNLNSFNVAEANKFRWTAQFSETNVNNILTSRQVSLRF